MSSVTDVFMIVAPGADGQSFSIDVSEELLEGLREHVKRNFKRDRSRMRESRFELARVLE